MSIEHLLQPLEHGGAGISLLHESEYDAIAAARQEDDASLPRGIWTRELKRADWPLVVQLCESALICRSKDLQIAAWLGEAWIASDGLAGGVRASALLDGLCERFWEQLHPLPRNGDMAFRTAPFDWADEYWSTALLLRAPLIGGRDPDARAVTLAQWLQALAADNALLRTTSRAEEKRDDKRADEGGRAALAALSCQTILAQLASEPPAALAAQRARAAQWRAALQQPPTVSGLTQPQAPRLSKLCNMLDQVGELLHHGQVEPPPVPAPVPVPAAAPAPPPLAASLLALAAEQASAGSAPAAPAVGSRDEAYRQLGTIADYLAQTEPHSPVPALLRRAVVWGHLPFHQLIAELSHNNNEMHTLLLRKPLAPD